MHQSLTKMEVVGLAISGCQQNDDDVNQSCLITQHILFERSIEGQTYAFLTVYLQNVLVDTSRLDLMMKLLELVHVVVSRRMMLSSTF
jgi:hypothetical protein